MYTASSRLVMVRSPLVIPSVSKCCAAVSTMVSLYTNRCSIGILRTPPIPSRYATIDPVHVGGSNRILL